MKKMIVSVVIVLLVIAVSIYVYQTNEKLTPLVGGPAGHEDQAIQPEESPTGTPSSEAPLTLPPSLSAPISVPKANEPDSNAQAPSGVRPQPEQEGKSESGVRTKPGSKASERRENFQKAGGKSQKFGLPFLNNSKQSKEQPPLSVQAKDVPAKQVTVTHASPGCWVAHYQHKFVKSHEDGDVCMYHKNQITLPTTYGMINPASICVQANGISVHHQVLQGGSILLNPGPNMKTDLTIRFCNEQTTCSIPCQVKKDKFMAAIGAEDEDDDELLGNKKKGAAHWGAKDRTKTEKEAKLDSELDRLDRDTEDDKKKMSVFKDWIKRSDEVFCQGKEKTRR